VEGCIVFGRGLEGAFDSAFGNLTACCFEDDESDTVLITDLGDAGTPAGQILVSNLYRYSA